MSRKLAINLWSDGSCLNGRGTDHHTGYGFAVTCNKVKIALGMGHSEFGTNNTAELQGISEGLRWLYLKGFGGYEINILSDSTYSINSYSKWRRSREMHGYGASEYRDAVKNAEIIQAGCAIMDSFASYPTFQWVKGHSGIYWNEVCDRLAGMARLYRIDSLVISNPAEIRRVLRER